MEWKFIMADENLETVETPPSNPAQQTPPSNPPAQSSHPSTPPQFITDLRASLDALPEKVANAIAEAMPKPTTTAPPQKAAETARTAEGQGSTGEGSNGPQRGSQRRSEPTQQTPPGRKTFAEWWNGVPAGTYRG